MNLRDSMSTDTAPLEQSPSTTTMENVGVVVSAPTPLPAIAGGQKDDQAKQVTDPWPARVATILTTTGITGLMLFEWFRSAEPRLQIVCIVAITTIVSVYLVCNAVGKWQMRAIEADPTKINVR